MIQRARHSPLHIHDLSDSYSTATQGPDAFHDIITNTVRQQISRIQELGLVTYIPPPESDQTPFLLSLTTAAPMLKSLKIQTQYQLGRDTIDLPSDFLGGHFPLLQRIDLTLLATNSWTMLSSGSLVYMHINLCIPHSSYDPLLDMLAANPGLQDVSLCNCLPAHSVPYRGRKAVELPSLKVLCLKGWDSTCANILQALRMPAKADLILNEIESSRDHFRSLFAEFEAHFARGSTEDFRHLHTTCSSSRFEVHLTTHLNTKGVSSFDPSRYSFTFSTAFIPDVTGTAVICRAFDKLPVANIETLSLRNAAIRPLWVDGLARLQRIKSITIEDELRNSQPSESILFESGQHGLVHYFPELKELKIVKTNLCDRYPYPDGKCSQAALLSLLIRRSELQPAASQLERLHILDCTVSFDNIWRLEAVVPIVEANGGRKGEYSDGKANKKGKRT
ncbi:uncharacterized protein STEHIDRAFT_152869 [Stereum hirsutum FP-91666 SS1]|uniref:uncharacterized protein n=1 Tax=Stereum hirsutum (strain FP-91666) TaxID=721885 RepID=UPI000440E946|nr:uncharacterized protein STEHIDRAFT_152869 [Stereum hirsutum FP-91666 SS1]EIM91210.1 hypothetical protein STEHIDRAFT_152869 [Stereum hirsutum FP-91666 SS1]